MEESIPTVAITADERAELESLRLVCTLPAGRGRNCHPEKQCPLRARPEQQPAGRGGAPPAPSAAP